MIQREKELERLCNLRNTNLIKANTGIRRAETFTLFRCFQQELLNSGVDECNIISLNLEEIESRALFEAHVLNDYVMKFVDKSKKNYVFFDEI